ncbi:MAG: hypothetical protein EKK62_07685 [Acidimicrobiia bacterium]|nr:MAG: hypothetical protein EKK62_07685 [Acidimicrobiia bacterium]
MPGYVSRPASGKLASYDGATCVAMFVDADGKAAIEAAAESVLDITFLSELTSFEIGRTTFTAEADATLGVITVAVDEFPEVDTSGGDPAGIVVAVQAGGSDAARVVVAAHTFAERPGVAADPVSFGSAGFASWEPAPGVLVRRLGSLRPDVNGVLDPEQSAALLAPYLDAGGSGTGATLVAAALVADADLSGGSFTTLDVVDPVTGTATTADVPRAGFVGAIVAVLSGTDGGKLWTVTSSGACTLVAACAAGDLVVILANRYVVQASNADGFGGVAAAGAADRFSLHIPYEGAGLDSDINDVHAGLRNHEGTLDRWAFMSAIAESNVDLNDLGAATFTYGALDFTGSAPHCHIWLTGQTTTSENGFYEVEPGPGYAATKINHPDIFDPPGQGYRVTLKSGDSDDGKTWVWLNDKPDDRMRVNGDTDEAETGRWVEWIGFTTGGSGSVATDTIWNAAGDLAIGTGSDTATRLAIGTSGQLLKSNGTTAAWATVTASDVGAAATSHTHAASDVTSGTLDIARIPTGTSSSTVAIGNDSRFTQVLGGQDEGTAVTSSSATSLLDSTINLAGLAAGDSIDIAASMRHLNNSGSSRSHTVTVKIGATTVATMTTPSMASSASYRFAVLRATIRVEAASDQNTMATHTITGLTTAADGSASTENLSSGAALDITGAVGAGGSQEIQLLQLSVTRNRA